MNTTTDNSAHSNTAAQEIDIVISRRHALTDPALLKEELGLRWLQPDLFRVGAFSLLGDIERPLKHRTTSACSADDRHAVG